MTANQSQADTPQDSSASEAASDAGANASDASGASPSAERDALRAERDELVTQLARARADYQNLRKRTQLDIDNAVRRSLENLLQNLFVVVDNLDFALKTDARSEDARQLAHGVELTRRQFLHALSQEGAAPIPDSAQFDPKLHEAVTTVQSAEHAPGAVVDVLRRGWTWRGTVLRASHVRVAAAPAVQTHSSGSDTAAAVQPE